MEVIMEVLPAFGDAWGLILQPVVLGYLVMGVLMGLCIGLFLGMGGIAGLSLLLPSMFGLEPVLGLAFMIGMVAVGPTSDTLASVLTGIPGSSASQATVPNGFPMSKKGQAGRALSAAFASSLTGGGLVEASSLTVFILLARPIVLEFHTPELLMITIFGLSMVGILAGRIAIKGIVAAGLVGRSADVILCLPLSDRRVETGHRGPWHLCHPPRSSLYCAKTAPSAKSHKSVPGGLMVSKTGLPISGCLCGAPS